MPEDDYAGAIDAAERMEALLRWVGVEPVEPETLAYRRVETNPVSGAISACIIASRAISVCRRWTFGVSETDRKEVRKRLARRQEWYALAIWNRLNDPGS